MLARREEADRTPKAEEEIPDKEEGMEKERESEREEEKSEQ